MSEARLIGLVQAFCEAMLSDRATISTEWNGHQAPRDAIEAYNALQQYAMKHPEWTGPVMRG